MKAVFVLCLLLSATSLYGAGLEEANTRDEADVYASGTLVGASNAQTIYAFDVKFAYRQYKTHLPGSSFKSKWYLQARPLLEYVTNQGTSTSPDYVNLGGEVGLFRQFRRGGPFRPDSVEIVFNPRAEFDRSVSTRNFVVATFARLPFPNYPDRPSPVNLHTSLELGMESGHNYSNVLQPQGSGTIARAYGSLSLLFWHCGIDPDTHARKQCEAGKRNLELKYEFRAPLQQEIFTQTLQDPAVQFLSSKPRHYFEAGVRIPVFSYFALHPQYKWGSLPPAFSFLDHQYTLNLEVSAKRKK